MSRAILTYHSLDSSGAVTSLLPGVFEHQLRFLSNARIPVLPLEDLLHAPRGVALTFDDGYSNLSTYALPALARHGFSATFFINSESAAQGGRYLDWPALRDAVSAGIQLGSHGLSHLDLSRLPLAQAAHQLDACRRDIQDHTGVEVRTCAYPYGRSTPQLRDWARTAFAASCGTRLRYLSSLENPADLPRLDVYYLRSPFWFERLFHPAGRRYLGLRALLREARAHWSPTA